MFLKKMQSIKKILLKNLDCHIKILKNDKLIILEKVKRLSEQLIKCINSGNKILVFGNGGSASDAQHFSTELTVRLKKNRKALPCISLSTDTSALTAIGNDFSFKFIFKRQIEAIGNRGDLLIAFSTSGKSKNILEGLKKAKQKFLKTILISSEKLKSNLSDVDILFKAPSKTTSRIQETHLFIIHILCKLLDEKIK